MKYYYFPSTYFDRGGGALRGYGYMVAGGRRKVRKAKKVDPLALAAALPPAEQKLITDIEETASPVEIGNKRWDFWDKIKTIAGETWKGTKDVVGFAADTIGKLRWSPLEIIRAINEIKNPQGALERFGFKVVDSAPGILNSVAKLVSPLSAIGLGYRGGRLRKGSPEAKAYMARLRAMRRKKKYFY